MPTHDDLVTIIRTMLDAYLDQVDPDDIDTDALAESIATALTARGALPGGSH
ncbi:hypothetical protein AB0I93_38960 [Streptomyces sp. NPDC049967]|uniref:hypothetical protein n=1 Tax=unclassified Streptomyces TaxID=2593676 RepID=UPI002E2D6006|nr:hypothetical protein [Streptomyces sp. NBC_00304]